MKPSHLTTPRQLVDCAFTPSADPITRPDRESWPTHSHLAHIGLALIAIVLLAMLKEWI